MNVCKRVCCFLLVMLFSGIQWAVGQLPRQEMVLKQGWRFMADASKTGEHSNWYNGLPAQAQPVEVPHTWNVMDGLEDFAGTGWYENTFTVPASWRNKQVRVKFAAVYHSAVIYVNGQKVQTHANAGYTTFYVDISKHLKYGTTNKLVVAVSNAFSTSNLPYGRSSDWCNDGGLIRDVSLVVTGKPSIRYVHVTPSIQFDDTTATARIQLRLWEKTIKSVQAAITIREKRSGQVVKTFTGNLSKKDSVFTTQLDLGKVQLWHFNDPFLYDIQVKLLQKNTVTDELTSRFGCREVKVMGNKLYVNREAVRLPGMEYMPGSYPAYGNAEPKWVMDSVVHMFKDLNVTISRFHWQVDEYMLDLMDEKGILLQAEIPWWQQPGKLSPALMAVAKQQFTEMIERDYNHPCIFAWGVSNELYGNDKDTAQFAYLRDFVKGLDSSRLVNFVSNEILKRKTEDESLVGDLPTWNEYIGTWHGKATTELPQYFQEIESFIGDRPLLITENGLCEPRFAGGDLRRVDDMIYHYKEWAKRDYVVGGIYFCLNDYRTHRGEDGAGKFKARIHGVTDLYFNKKPSYYVFKRLASPIEITNVKKLSDVKIEVELVNKNSLPFYTVRGYTINWKTKSGATRWKLLPVLKPGDKITVQLEDLHERFAFEVLSPLGYHVVGYPFVR
jgi:Beta-galactosidase/beta-glucuronidase